MVCCLQKLDIHLFYSSTTTNSIQVHEMPFWTSVVSAFIVEPRDPTNMSK